MQARPKPTAPPVYRPQPTPKVLQRKATTVQPSPTGSTKRPPAAPPAYRPQPVPKVLQPKVATNRPMLSAQASQKPIAPQVYRPKAPTGTLQAKSHGQPRVASIVSAPHSGASGTASRHKSPPYVQKPPHRGAVVQRTPEQADALIGYGKRWNTEV